MKIIKHKKRFTLIFISVSAIFLMLFLVLYFYDKKIEKAVSVLSARKFSIKDTGCIIKTFGRNTEALSAKISFYTPTGTLINSYERSWLGWELNLECIGIETGSNILVFPYRAFSDKTKYGTGICLFPYYSDKNFPTIYDYPTLSEAERSAIKSLFKMPRYSPYSFKVFSGAKNMSIKLSEFKPDNEYSLLVNSKKTIYLKKN